MGLLDLFSRKPDPTHDWPASSASALRLDMVRRELNGIALGAPFTALRVLGRPQNPKPVRERSFVYPPIGLTVALDAKSEVFVFTCVFQAGFDGEADEYPGFVPCRIALQNEGGTLLEITRATTAGVLEAVLGPLDRSTTGEGEVGSKVVGRTWLGFHFDSAGGLTLLDIEPAENVTGENR